VGTRASLTESERGRRMARWTTLCLCSLLDLDGAQELLVKEEEVEGGTPPIAADLPVLPDFFVGAEGE